MEKYHLYHWMPSFSQSVQSNNTSHLIPCKLISPNITYPSLSSPNGQAHTCGWYRELLPGVFRGAAREPKMYSTVPIYCMPLIKPHGRIWCAIVHLYIHKYLMGIYVNHIQYKYTWYTTYKYTSKKYVTSTFPHIFSTPNKNTWYIFTSQKKKHRNLKTEPLPASRVGSSVVRDDQLHDDVPALKVAVPVFIWEDHVTKWPCHSPCVWF